MKRILPGFAALLLVSALGSCRNPAYDNATAYFWSDDDHEKRYLFIDGKKTGALPFIEVDESQSGTAHLSEAITVTLPSGAHEIEIRNDRGRRVSDGELRFEKSRNSETISTSWHQEAHCKVKVVYQ